MTLVEGLNLWTALGCYVRWFLQWYDGQLEKKQTSQPFLYPFFFSANCEVGVGAMYLDMPQRRPSSKKMRFYFDFMQHILSRVSDILPFPRMIRVDLQNRL